MFTSEAKGFFAVAFYLGTKIGGCCLIGSVLGWEVGLGVFLVSLSME